VDEDEGFLLCPSCGFVADELQHQLVGTEFEGNICVDDEGAARRLPSGKYKASGW
jgi:hypothetical protein